MNATIDIFLPKVIITNLDTVESMKQKITNTVANMGIGTIDMFDLNFSKKHMNHYGFITILLSNTDAARRFVRDIEDRGFAKLTDKDHYWRVCRYIAPENRRLPILNTAFIQEEEEEDEEVPDWEDPNEDEPFEFGLMHYVADVFESADAFDTSMYDSQILELLRFDEETPAVEQSTFDESAFEQSTFDESTFEQSTFEQSTFDFNLFLDKPLYDVPSCDYNVYTNWNQFINLSPTIIASRIFPDITMSVLSDEYNVQCASMPIPNLLIGVNNGMYETASSQKWSN